LKCIDFDLHEIAFGNAISTVAAELGFILGRLLVEGGFVFG
jgi:hypothetical protein